jgi:hypothetical protein
MNTNDGQPTDSEHGELLRIQRWMMDVITHPDGVLTGIDSSAANAQIEVSSKEVQSVILPSRSQTSIERLEVYANAFYSRLLECMRTSFPALVFALGDETFDAFSFGYLQQYPPHSYTLNALSEHFIDYLEATRPADDRSGVAGPNWTDFVIDLARLELTFDLVFDGPGVEDTPISSDWINAMDADRWEQTRLQPVPCLRLLKLHYPVSTYYTAWRRSESPQIPSPQPTFLAITRRDYIVRRHELAECEYHLLGKLIGGQSVGDAIADISQEYDDVDQFAKLLRSWFTRWGSLEFFSGQLDD